MPDQWRLARRLTVTPLDRPGRLALEPGIELFGPVNCAGEFLEFSLGALALTCPIEEFLASVANPLP